MPGWRTEILQGIQCGQKQRRQQKVLPTILPHSKIISTNGLAQFLDSCVCVGVCIFSFLF